MQGKEGYLWRLSTKRLVYTPEWKRKYCVISGGGYLYYYESETSQGGDRGSGVIDLRCVMDCVEAPLTDHKKATNVFILIAKQRGFFTQVIYKKEKYFLCWEREIRSTLNLEMFKVNYFRADIIFQQRLCLI